MQLAADGISIVGVNYRDTEPEARQFLDKLGNPYEFSFFDPKGYLAIEMGITAAPETFLISPQGEVLFHRVGEMNEKIFNQHFAPLMRNN